MYVMGLCLELKFCSLKNLFLSRIRLLGTTMDVRTGNWEQGTGSEFEMERFGEYD